MSTCESNGLALFVRTYDGEMVERPDVLPRPFDGRGRIRWGTIPMPSIDTTRLVKLWIMFDSLRSNGDWGDWLAQLEMGLVLTPQQVQELIASWKPPTLAS